MDDDVQNERERHAILDLTDKEHVLHSRSVSRLLSKYNDISGVQQRFPRRPEITHTQPPSVEIGPKLVLDPASSTTIEPRHAEAASLARVTRMITDA